MNTPIESRRAGDGWPKRYGRWIDDPTDEQQAVLDTLAERSDERGELVSSKAYMTTSGRLRLDELYAGLREQITRGVELHIGHEQMRDWMRVNRTAYYKIKNGRTGSGS